MRCISSARFTLAFLTLGSLLLSASAGARDLQGRLGLGYNAELANVTQPGGVPALSIKYGLTKDLGVEGIFGTDTQGPRNTALGIKGFKNIFYETNLNFYTMAGAAMLTANNRSGAEFLGGFGVEFFIPGLESLGLSMETGLSLDNLDTGAFALKTMGFSFLNAGMHFYF